MLIYNKYFGKIETGKFFTEIKTFSVDPAKCAEQLSLKTSHPTDICSKEFLIY